MEEPEDEEDAPTDCFGLGVGKKREYQLCMRAKMISAISKHQNSPLEPLVVVDTQLPRVGIRVLDPQTRSFEVGVLGKLEHPMELSLLLVKCSLLTLHRGGC